MIDYYYYLQYLLHIPDILLVITVVYVIVFDFYYLLELKTVETQCFIIIKNTTVHLNLYLQFKDESKTSLHIAARWGHQTVAYLVLTLTRIDIDKLTNVRRIASLQETFLILLSLPF